jgi:hypothetical protein
MTHFKVVQKVLACGRIAAVTLCKAPVQNLLADRGNLRVLSPNDPHARVALSSPIPAAPAVSLNQAVYSERQPWHKMLFL